MPSGLEAELCLWAILGRLADELRPWEDFVGEDSDSGSDAITTAAAVVQ